MSFDTHVDYRTIPSRQSHDHDYHGHDDVIDESNEVDKDEDPYQLLSTVPPLLA
jgi:hypothetical protein